MQYNFDKITERRGTNSLKYDFALERGKPKDILPLWVADMDFPVAKEITESLMEAVNHGIYGYSDAKESYFQAVAGWMEQNHSWKVEKEWLVKTPGVVFAIAMAIRALTRQGDSVMIQTPVYYPFKSVVEDNGRVLVENTLVEKDGRYTMDLFDFEQKIRDEKVKMLVLCSPHNPVGRVWTKEELLAVGEICLKYGVYVVCDEIHQDFVYPGNCHSVFVSLREEFQKITITCTAPSKTFNIAGLQISNIFIPNPDIRVLFQAEIDKTGYCEINKMGLIACESAYRYGREWLSQLQNYLQGNLDFMRNFLEERIPQLKLVEPEGTYLVWVDFRALGLSHDELENLIVNKAGLWLDNGRIFGETGEGYQRFNIACPRETLKEALLKLEKALQ